MLTNGILAKSAVSWPHAQLLWQGVTPESFFFFFFLTNTKVVTSKARFASTAEETGLSFYSYQNQVLCFLATLNWPPWSDIITIFIKILVGEVKERREHAGFP